MTSIPQSCLSSLQTDAEALCLHPRQSSNQPVAQISIHTRAAIQTWVCLVRGTGDEDSPEPHSYTGHCSGLSQTPVKCFQLWLSLAHDCAHTC